jgi:hypothetical protein
MGSDSEPTGLLTKYCAFIDLRGNERIGHLDVTTETIQPLAFKSGTNIANLYQVIKVGDGNIIPTGEPIPRSSVRLLPPISGRDILCVGRTTPSMPKSSTSPASTAQTRKISQPILSSSPNALLPSSRTEMTSFRTRSLLRLSTMRARSV